MEDFVPYELAVKLEQKGFKQEYNIFGYRPIFSDETTIRFISYIGAYENEYFGENIAAPTISQVLKWLRDKEVYVVPTFCVDQNDNGYWDFRIIDLIDGTLIYDEIKNRYNTYEQAALAGIEYLINNLF